MGPALLSVGNGGVAVASGLLETTSVSGAFPQPDRAGVS